MNTQTWNKMLNNVETTTYLHSPVTPKKGALVNEMWLLWSGQCIIVDALHSVENYLPVNESQVLKLL